MEAAPGSFVRVKIGRWGVEGTVAKKRQRLAEREGEHEDDDDDYENFLGYMIDQGEEESDDDEYTAQDEIEDDDQERLDKLVCIPTPFSHAHHAYQVLHRSKTSMKRRTMP